MEDANYQFRVLATANGSSVVSNVVSANTANTGMSAFEFYLIWI
jgi:hypothetical protein